MRMFNAKPYPTLNSVMTPLIWATEMDGRTVGRTDRPSSCPFVCSPFTWADLPYLLSRLTLGVIISVCWISSLYIFLKSFVWGLVHRKSLPKTDKTDTDQKQTYIQTRSRNEAHDPKHRRRNSVCASGRMDTVIGYSVHLIWIISMQINKFWVAWPVLKIFTYLNPRRDICGQNAAVMSRAMQGGHKKRTEWPSFQPQ